MKWFVTVLVIIFVSSTQSQLPPSFKVCQRNSPNLANCLKDAIEHVKPYLKTGDFGHGWKIDPFEPVFIEDIVVEKSRGLFINVRNIQVHNANNFRIDKIKVNMENFNLDIIVDFKNLDAIGDYKSNIKIAALNLKGEGKFKVAIDEVKAHVKLVMHHYTKNGEEFIRISSVPIRVLKLGKVKVNLQDLFNNKNLNEITNAIVNDNAHLFIDDFVPKVTNAVSKNLIKTGNVIIDRVPFKHILPF